MQKAQKKKKKKKKKKKRNSFVKLTGMKEENH